MTGRLEVHERIRNLGQELSDEEFVQVLLTVLQRRDYGFLEKLLEALAARWLAEESHLLDAAASLAAHHHALEGDGPRLRSLLALLTLQGDLVRQLGGEPYRVLDDVAQVVMAQSRLQGEAIQTIWREPMLGPKDAAVALGARATNREKVRQYRERSWLLGLPVGRGYLYPAFQFDAERRDVFPEVRSINERLDAADDSWGVASWWISRHARLEERPVDLVGTDRADDLIAAAAAVTEPVG